MTTVFDPTKNSPESIVSSLTYINYKHNRQMSPEISPERWGKVYGPSTPAMEEHYQRELSAERVRSRFTIFRSIG